MNPPRVRVFAPPERATGIEAVFMGSNVKSISGARIFVYPWRDDVSVFRLKRKRGKKENSELLTLMDEKCMVSL